MIYLLIRNMRLKYIKEDKNLFTKGDPAKFFIFILKGTLNLFAGYSKNPAKFVRALGSGASLGERGIIRREPRSLTCYADEDSVLIQVDANSFRKIMQIAVKEKMERKIAFIRQNFPNGAALPRS
jgi:CRP-like cAMP-binding protein